MCALAGISYSTKILSIQKSVERETFSLICLFARFLQQNFCQDNLWRWITFLKQQIHLNNSQESFAGYLRRRTSMSWPGQRQTETKGWKERKRASGSLSVLQHLQKEMHDVQLTYLYFPSCLKSCLLWMGSRKSASTTPTTPTPRSLGWK